MESNFLVIATCKSWKAQKCNFVLNPWFHGWIADISEWYRRNLRFNIKINFICYKNIFQKYCMQKSLKMLKNEWFSESLWMIMKPSVFLSLRVGLVLIWKFGKKNMEIIDHYPVAISRALRPIEFNSSASAPLSNKTLTQDVFWSLRVLHLSLSSRTSV